MIVLLVHLFVYFADWTSVYSLLGKAGWVGGGGQTCNPPGLITKNC